MSKALIRFMKTQAGLATEEGDWLTLNRLTETPNPTELECGRHEGENPSSDEEVLPSRLSCVPRWLNSTNITELLLARTMLSPTNEILSETVTARFLDMAVALGTSVLQAAEDATTETEVDAISLTVPYKPVSEVHSYLGIPTKIEIVFDVVDGVDLSVFLRRVVLSRQVAMVRYRFPEAHVFTVIKSDKSLDLFIDHGWKHMHPEFELVLEREHRGGLFDPKDHWLQAPQ